MPPPRRDRGEGWNLDPPGRSSSLLNQPERQYFNCFLNEADSNRPELRNNHGAQANAYGEDSHP